MTMVVEAGTPDGEVRYKDNLRGAGPSPPSTTARDVSAVEDSKFLCDSHGFTSD